MRPSACQPRAAASFAFQVYDKYLVILPIYICVCVCARARAPLSMPTTPFASQVYDKYLVILPRDPDLMQYKTARGK